MLASLTLATFFRYENVVASNSLTCGAERRELAQVETGGGGGGGGGGGSGGSGGVVMPEQFRCPISQARDTPHACQTQSACTQPFLPRHRPPHANHPLPVSPSHPSITPDHTVRVSLSLTLTLTLTLHPTARQEVMVDPVTTSDGQTYERREIFRW